jgi:hypothetical protein
MNLATTKASYWIQLYQGAVKPLFYLLLTSPSLRKVQELLGKGRGGYTVAALRPKLLDASLLCEGKGRSEVKRLRA